MGVLIHLPERAPREMAAPADTPVSAAILFFTGVRYVRDSSRTPEPGDSSAHDAPRPRRRRGG